jgi:endonuclease YncB( thermonuclease family)
MKPGPTRRRPLLAAVLALVFAGALAASVAAAAAQSPKLPAAFEGRVVQVLDGETLVLRLPDKSEQTVRLRHIDAPEPCQPGGPESTQALVDQALGKDVQVRDARRLGSAGRLQAAVLLDGLDLSRRQVAEGQAWSLRWRHDTGPLVKEERMAQALRRGLHAAGNAEMPQAFRQRHGPCR